MQRRPTPLRVGERRETRKGSAAFKRSEWIGRTKTKKKKKKKKNGSNRSSVCAALDQKVAHPRTGVDVGAVCQQHRHRLRVHHASGAVERRLVLESDWDGPSRGGWRLMVNEIPHARTHTRKARARREQQSRAPLLTPISILATWLHTIRGYRHRSSSSSSFIVFQFRDKKKCFF